MCSFITNKNMNDQQDQFFVQPQVEEVHDIKLIQQPNNILDKAIQQPKKIQLKYDIPYSQCYKFQKHSNKNAMKNAQQSDSDESESPNNNSEAESPFLDVYSMKQCVYQRMHNEQFNRINETSYFSGAFLHRNIFLEGNYSQSCELEDAAKAYYQLSSTPLPKGEEEGDLIFDSKFQSGNLFAAFKVGPTQYDLVMSNDVNSVGNNQWFYFSVQNLVVDKEYTFSVVNFTKSDSLFNYGMAPAVYSLAENKYNYNVQRGWRRFGKQVTYKKGIIPKQNSKRMYYRLTFKMSTIFQKDKLLIAHSYPYTLQKLNNYITDKANKNKQIVTKFNIGKTLSKRPIEGMMICHPLNKKRDNRKAIIIMARQHPGETQGSFVCEGVVQKLLSKGKQAEFLIKNFVFYVIPMVNPDGVVYGHYRTNLSGKDLNRKWNATQKDLNCPEVAAIKSYIQQISKERDIRFILDLHGHSKKLNSFFYGNPCPQNPDVVRIYPYVCSKLHSGVQYLDCTFSTEEYKRKAARIYLSFLYKLIHVYTFQSSFYAYFKEGKKIEFTPKEYKQLGGTLITSLFLQLEHEVKYSQSTEFNLKKINPKEVTNSPFLKILSQLKTNKQLLQTGVKCDSGSESKPEQAQINNQDLQQLKPVRPQSSPIVNETKNISNTTKISRKGNREAKQFNFNKPIRNIKFLEISRVNSILPDKYQLGLQPIKKKEIVEEITKPLAISTKVFGQAQTDPRTELKGVQFKSAQIQNCILSNSVRLQPIPQRKYTSMIRSNNKNIIFKFDMFGQTTSRQEEMMNQRPLILKQAYSQTIITYSKEQGEKIKSSQILPIVQSPERDDRKWARNNSIRVQSSMKGGVRRQAELFFNGIVKKLMNEKEVMRSEQLSTKFVLQKPLLIKKKEIMKK